MERTEFVALMSPLVVAMRSQFDQPTWTVYYRALEDVPVPLLEGAVDRALKSGSAFMPKPGELRKFAEDARQALLQAHPFEPCAICSQQGWVATEVGGVSRMVRCRCWAAHQENLHRLGGISQPLALPPAPAAVDWTTAIGEQA